MTREATAAIELPGRETPQRRAILAALASFDGPFSAAELHARALKLHPRLGVATTYRTLELLQSIGAARHVPGGPSADYIVCAPDHHHHLVCLSCGGVEDTELCATPSAAELKRRHGFVAERHELDIYGTCARCA